MAELVVCTQNYACWLVTERPDILRYWPNPKRFLSRTGKFWRENLRADLNKFWVGLRIKIEKFQVIKCVGTPELLWFKAFRLNKFTVNEDLVGGNQKQDEQATK